MNHQWARITVAGEPWDISADAVMVDGQRITVTYAEALEWAEQMGAELPTAAMVDARWEAADLKNDPHTQPLHLGQNDAAEHSYAVDCDVAEHRAMALGEPRIVGNCGKHWVRAEHGGHPLYGWHVPADLPSWRGIKAHRAASSETTSRVLQPYSPTAHGANHKDYSMTLVLARRPQPSEPPDTIPGSQAEWHAELDLTATPLGHRLVVWLGYQFGLAPREIPGPKHDPVILSYSEHCRRGGRFLGVTASGNAIWDGGLPLALPGDDSPWHWCAATQSEALRACLLPGDPPPPHGLRVSVRELVEDARAAGTLRPAHWVPTPGSLAILARGGSNPLYGGPGHVRGVVQVEDDRYLGIGGNEGDTVKMAWHDLGAADLVAWIER